MEGVGGLGGLEVRVRFRAREEQRTPRVVHRQRVHLFEVAGRRHRPVEGAVELVDHLRRELLEVRLGVLSTRAGVRKSAWLLLRCAPWSVVDAGRSEKECVRGCFLRWQRL